ncbi:MAG: SDR family NAD(P)-dependent oxidoreductase [Myxococcota bacterium]
MNLTAVLTGATSGIGLETARALRQAGIRVIAVARDRAKGEAIAAELGVEVELADLSVPSETRAAAARIADRVDAIDLVVNNAGGLFATRQVTADGLERTFATNHLGYFVLTTALLAKIERAAAPRVVIVSSEAHRSASIAWDDLQHGRWRGNGWPAYGQSKLMNLLFARELARRAPRIEVHTVHPGFVASGFGRNNGPVLRSMLNLASGLARTPAQGADTVVWAATDPSLAGTTNRYWADRSELVPSADARDDAAAARLWEETEVVLRATP